MKTLKTSWIILLSAMAVTAVYTQAQTKETPILQLLSELAEKPEHHQSIADYYRTMSDEARAEVKKHETMKNAYRQSYANEKTRGAGQAMLKHCKSLIQLYQSAATEYELLAVLHEAKVHSK